MKNKNEFAEIRNPQERQKSWRAENINTCVACGMEIPEGMFVCRKCEKELRASKCIICDAPLQENEISLCTRCRITFMYSNNKDQ